MLDTYEQLYHEVVRAHVRDSNRLSACLEVLKTLYNSELMRGTDELSAKLRELVRDTIEASHE